jgi:RimJ/RimL family protein N-acetyltransferase
LSKGANFAIELRDTNVLIGCVGLLYCGEEKRSRQMGDADGEIGYWLGVPYWGKGYAVEAVESILSDTSMMEGIDVLWCDHYDGNERSKRVMEKCGFVYHHTEPDKLAPLLGEVRTEHYYQKPSV